MFDLRYHVASLAAVFLALIIGILVGVGISGRGFVSESERKLLDARISELQGRLHAASQRAADLSRAQEATKTFIDSAYPALMHERLPARRIAVVFVGSVDGHLRSTIEQALADAGAPGPIRIRALKVPVDVKALDKVLAPHPALASYAGDTQLDNLGRALGEEFVSGGETPLWSALAAQLVEERTGGMQRPADGVVLVRTATAQQGGTARFLAGFYSGLGAGTIPIVGVESSNGATSAVSVYRKAGLSSVDDVDTPAGRLALALLLAGGRPGQYGLKPTAEDGIVPPIEPLPIAAVPSG